MNESQNETPKIYLLPNLMTAGNLFCGFAATLLIVRGTLAMETGETQIPYFNQSYFHLAIWLILIACIFDLLDGRLARLGGHESEFGREFDSLADVISFGVAPAMLLYKIVLQDFEYGWMVAFLYLLCGALRLARFNCIAAKGGGADKDFRGFPIPAAAGVISSVTLFILWWEGKNREFDVLEVQIPELQGVELAHERVHPAVHLYFPDPHLYRAALRLDAGGDLHRLPALRFPAPVPLASDAA